MSRYFTAVYGNDFHKNRIASAIMQSSLPHALLIDGPDGSGKLTFAKEIAAALNCENKESASHPFPCGKCNSCRRIRENTFTDVKILSRQSDKATIGVKEIKDFRSDMYLTATESQYKVYIIDEAEKMTTEAQNALLIILEEPPKNVVIMLLSSSTDAILTTIKSRTQYIPMSRFSTDELDAYLKENNSDAARLSATDKEAYRAMLVSADGRIGKAKELLNPVKREESLAKREEILAVIKAISNGSRYADLYEAITSLPSKRAEFLDALELLVMALADMIAVKKSDEVVTVFFTDTEAAREMCHGISQAKLIKVYDHVIETHSECTKNANVNLAAINLAAKIKLA